MVPSMAQPLALKYRSAGEFEILPIAVGDVIRTCFDHPLAAAIGADRGFLFAFGDGIFVGVAVSGARCWRR